jgi:peptidoglycan/xylan/chitin deacetylase (PgdA/CDA1 family)
MQVLEMWKKYERAAVLKKVYYYFKPFIPRNLQLYCRSKLIERQRISTNLIWPISPGSEKKPDQFVKWPDNKKFALVLTHDVETQKGHDRVNALVEIEQQYGLRSSFNFVPERYNVSPTLRRTLLERGFEVGVHGLKHDGKLFLSKSIFMNRAKKINEYLRDWNASGFRSPAMHHNLEWIKELNIEYDSSTFDTDPFEPQPDNVNSIFPFWVPGDANRPGYVELPYTLPQDFTLFILMKEKNIDIWRRKLDWIAENNGMALVNVHPDYINFGKGKSGPEEFQVKLYTDFLDYIKLNYENEYWQPLPVEMSRYYRKINMISTEQKVSLNIENIVDKPKKQSAG